VSDGNCGIISAVLWNGNGYVYAYPSRERMIRHLVLLLLMRVMRKIGVVNSMSMMMIAGMTRLFGGAVGVVVVLVLAGIGGVVEGSAVRWRMERVEDALSECVEEREETEEEEGVWRDEGWMYRCGEEEIAISGSRCHSR